MVVTDQHKILAGLPQAELIRRIRLAADDNSLLLWEMVGLSHIYSEVRAGPVTASRLGVSKGEVIAYSVPDGGGHITGGAISDLMNVDSNQQPSKNDVIGTLRWHEHYKKD